MSGMFRDTQIPIRNKGWRPSSDFVFCAWNYFNQLQTLDASVGPANLRTCSAVYPGHSSDCVLFSNPFASLDISSHKALLSSPSAAIMLGWILLCIFTHSPNDHPPNSAYHRITITKAIINGKICKFGVEDMDPWLSACLPPVRP